MAIEKNDISIVKLLLSNKNLDINSKKIELSQYYGEKIEILLYWIYELTALNIAVEYSNIEIIKLLLANDKIDINEISIVKKIHNLLFLITFLFTNFNKILMILCFNGISLNC